MTTAPIKPTATVTAKPATSNPLPSPPAVKTDKTPAPPRGLPQPNAKGPSPLQKQHRDVRAQPDYMPVQITFLTGPFTGKTIDLGLAVNEISHSESVEWEQQGGDGKKNVTSIRPGLNFKSISVREISLTLTYFDLNLDISHLVENLKHLGEIADSEKTPPRLLYVQGDLRAVECVCTSFQDKYSDPLPFSVKPGRNGFRKCEVSLTLKLIGGLNNPNTIGGPLTSTPLGDYKTNTTQAERQKRSRTSRIETLMAPCLNEKSAELQALVDSNKQGDIGEIAKLSPEVFVQSAIAGVFSTEILKSERLKQKLKEDLALVMAQNTDGIANTPETRNFANALTTGNPASLRDKIRDQFVLVKPDFDVIASAIESQALDESGDIFDRNKYRTAGQRLYDAGSCGLALRRNGGTDLGVSTKEDAKTLKDINTFLTGNPSDDDIKKRFGVETESQIRAIKNGAPYQNKDQFIQQSSTTQAGITGYSLWAKFSEASQ